jgi:hypothetical protein
MATRAREQGELNHAECAAGSGDFATRIT